MYNPFYPSIFAHSATCGNSISLVCLEEKKIQVMSYVRDSQGMNIANINLCACQQIVKAVSL